MLAMDLDSPEILYADLGQVKLDVFAMQRFVNIYFLPHAGDSGWATNLSVQSAMFSMFSYYIGFVSQTSRNLVSL